MGAPSFTRWGARSFQAAAPQLWNSLPVSIRMIKSIEIFLKICENVSFWTSFLVINNWILD